jgi:hypothetical protein
MLHEFDDNVIEILTASFNSFCPEWVQLSISSDYLVLFQNCTKSGMLVEVKPEKNGERIQIWRTKWKAARWARTQFLFHIYDEWEFVARTRKY